MAVPKHGRKGEEPDDQRRFAVKVDSAGRVLIPATLRKQYGMEPGTVVVLRPGWKGERITMRTRDAAIRESQAYFRQFKKPGEELLSEQLIRERHEQAKREYGG